MDGGFNAVTISNSDNHTFDWSATLGLDAVIVKAGTGANVYTYNPEVQSDGNLHAPYTGSDPLDPGTIREVSHVTFCFDYEVTVTKTANTTFTRTYAWTITKSVTPKRWDLFQGDSGTSTYTVAVDKTGYTDSHWAVSGSIKIKNNTPFAATITDVTDDIAGVGAVAVSCGVGFPYELASGQELNCTYNTALPNADARTNTATATTSGAVGGGSGTAAVTFGDPTTVVNGAINVTDTNGMSWGPVTDDTSWDYTRTFTCNDDEGTHPNTATITETGASDSASVTVHCYELTVTKDANPTFTRTWDWTITKSGDQSALTLAPGQSFLVNYEVTVTAAKTDSAWNVTGEIIVANPAPMPATLTAVNDIVSPNIAGTVTCPSLTVPANDTLTCTYSAALPDATGRTNTATASLQNYSYAADGTATANGTTDFTGTAAVSFGDPTSEIDECVDVTDDQAGVLGAFCVAVGNLSHPFAYSLTISYAACGDYSFKNMATATTQDSQTSDSASHTVTVTVPCAGGCTLTQGYWKTHSDRGPAPYDDAWKNLGALEEDTPFFTSGKSWYEVFRTPPAGNAYYNLAHQYMAAQLNILNGAASTPAVDAAMAGATALFTAQGVNDTTLTRAERTLALGYASTLDQYNNGVIGPGHCSEGTGAGGLGFEEAAQRIYLPTIRNR